MIKKLGKSFRSRVQGMSEKEAGMFVVSTICFLVIMMMMPSITAGMW